MELEAWLSKVDDGGLRVTGRRESPMKTTPYSPSVEKSVGSVLPFRGTGKPAECAGFVGRARNRRITRIRLGR